MNRSGQYDLIEQKFVTGSDEITITSLAREMGRTTSTVARMARIRGWYDKRAAYRESFAQRTYDATIDAHGPRIVKLHEKYLTAAEKTVDRYVEAIDNHEITPTPSDLAKIMSVVRELTAKPAAAEESPEAAGGIHLSEGVSRELVRSLEDLARARLESGAGPAAPRPKLVSAGQG